jgi:hypothetical protein
MPCQQDIIGFIQPVIIPYAILFTAFKRIGLGIGEKGINNKGCEKEFTFHGMFF